MNESILETYITDFIKEEQLKLGYLKEPVRIYYPLSSLNRYFKTALSAEEMLPFLKKACASMKAHYGEIEISRRGERFCLTVPEEGSEYVHSLPLRHKFLPQLLETVARHGCTMEDVVGVFRGQPYEFCVEQMQGEDFDCLIYFKDHPDDTYRYCFKDEGAHIIYHRFTPEDYDAMFA